MAPWRPSRTLLASLLASSGLVSPYAAEDLVESEPLTAEDPLLEDGSLEVGEEGVYTMDLPLPSVSGLVAAGRKFSFFQVPGSETLLAFGQNNHGQTGVRTIPNFLDIRTPTEVKFGEESPWIVSVAAGSVHALFLTSEGDVWASGWNRFGQLALPSRTGAKLPEPVKVLSDMQAISTGYGHTLFLTRLDQVQSCGQNQHGQLGLGDTRTRDSVSLVSFATKIIQISAGYDFSYFLADTDEVWAAGQNLGGQLGDQSYVTRLSPVKSYALNFVRWMQAGESHGLFLRGGETYGVGAGFAGQIGAQTYQGIRVRIVRLSRASMVWAGGDGSCGMFARYPDRMICIGSNQDGQLGGGADAFLNSSNSLLMGVGASSMGMGGTHTILMNAEYDDIQTTGTNANYELGNGTADAGRNTYAALGLKLRTTTTSTQTVTFTTISVTATTMTLTSIRQIQGNDDDLVGQDALMMQMLQVLFGMGAVAVVVGFCVRRVAARQAAAGDAPGVIEDLRREVEMEEQTRLGTLNQRTGMGAPLSMIVEREYTSATAATAAVRSPVPETMGSSQDEGIASVMI